MLVQQLLIVPMLASPLKLQNKANQGYIHIGHTLNLFAIKSPYYISASFKYACSPGIDMP